MVEEDSAVQSSVGVKRGGIGGDLRCVFNSCWMPEGCVRAIFPFPIVRCPAIVIKIAYTRVIRGNPIITWKFDLEYLIHVLIDSDVSVEKDTGFVGSQLESSELRPGVLKSGRYEGSLPVLW